MYDFFFCTTEDTESHRVFLFFFFTFYSFYCHPECNEVSVDIHLRFAQMTPCEKIKNSVYSVVNYIEQKKLTT